MKTHNLLPSVAAVLFTFASLSAVNYNIRVQPTTASKTGTINVTELAPVIVRPSAAELRAAALLADVNTSAIATIPAMNRNDGTGASEPFSLLGSPLAMPYYSFGNNKFGRISKE
jgi:hypothetical protein